MATRARKVVVIKSFLKWLHEQEYIQQPVHTGFINNEVHSQDRPNRDLAFEEVTSLLDRYKSHVINYAILSLVATTGLRIQEVANAKWRDLYFDSFDGRYYLKVTGKGRKEREAIIFNNVVERIQAFRKRRGFKVELDHHDDTPLLTQIRIVQYTKVQEYETPSQDPLLLSTYENTPFLLVF